MIKLYFLNFEFPHLNFFATIQTDCHTSELQVGSPPKGWDVYSLAGHTMTLVDNKALCIIGGYTGSQFSDLVYLYYILSDRWGTVNAQQPTGRQLHYSAVHRKNALLVRKLFRRATFVI